VPVAVALAKAVIAFLQRNSGAAITITKAGTVVAKNLDSKDAAKIAEAFAGRTPSYLLDLRHAVGKVVFVRGELTGVR
jgi:hypothetical protein